MLTPQNTAISTYQSIICLLQGHYLGLYQTGCPFWRASRHLHGFRLYRHLDDRLYRHRDYHLI